ncbi:MAG: hypothetical protein A2X94_03615 [Bdellovibrionales bacterium GWB1_55_8]|nr:MAG: hypothetical protein A2X94_03615 [Bdellovibrionales bacterium GWB1_55_8]
MSFWNIKALRELRLEPLVRLLAVLPLLLFQLFLGNAVWASTSLYPGFTYQGRFLTPDGTAPMTDMVDLVIGIYSPDASCLLYEERNSGIDLSQTSGLFSVHVGSEPGAPKRTGNDPGKSLSVIFANSAQVRAAGTNCSGGYTPAAGDPRRLRVTVYPQGASPETMSPDLTISPVPQSLVAETLQGLDPANFVQITGNASSYAVSKSALDTLLGMNGVQDASSLHHHDSLYAQLGIDGSLTMATGAYLGLGVRAGDPDITTWNASQTGQTWFDSSAGEIKYWDGSSIKSLGPSSAPPQDLDSAATPTFASVTLSSAPTQETDAATKKYVDDRLSGNFSAGTITASGMVTGTLQVTGGTPASGKVLTSDASGNATWQALSGTTQWTTSESNIFYSTGKVGIGTSSPAVSLDVNGGVRSGSSTAVTTCGAGQANGEGTQRYNYTTHNMEYCNGSMWIALGTYQ